MNLRIAAVATFVLLASGAAFAQDAAPAADQSQRVTEGDTLLIQRVQQENTAAMPARGMSMQEVEAKFGAPAAKQDPRGGQKRAWPTINRWTYPAFTVYFEKSRVIDAVANKADANEVGPKPAIR
ncbi:hypothetical protein LVB87_12005 [Lysobacter sp. KIS68-7]|nr:hypothetical protein [Lysobacter sp. KIS68-7]UHQ18904.1 hypothetical protein LVB87_12005 [Lysobacter sp. KIS68-7]